MTGPPIQVAVIGAGNMGKNHIRVFDQLPGANLRYVVEPDRGQANEVKAEYDVELLDDVRDLTGIDAVSIAVPNQLHRDIAVSCIRNGLDVLVEKPLALTVEDAEAIVAIAEEHQAIVQVGHIERFNPAVEALADILKDETLLAFDAHRLGPFTEHLTDESVVFDLMLHDIDLISALAPGELCELNAVGSNFRSNELDHAIATLLFDDGAIASTTASHVTHGKVRQIRAMTEEAFIIVDYQGQDLTIQRRGLEGTMPLNDGAGYRTETVTESPYLNRREPLKNELEHFLECVRNRGVPRVDGSTGIEAVRLATEVVSSIQNGNV